MREAKERAARKKAAKPHQRRNRTATDGDNTA